MEIGILIILWVFGIVMSQTDSSLSKQTKFSVALVKPLLWLAFVFIWNTWARHWIGWGEVTTAREFLVLMLVF